MTCHGTSDGKFSIYFEVWKWFFGISMVFFETLSSHLDCKLMKWTLAVVALSLWIYFHSFIDHRFFDTVELKNIDYQILAAKLYNNDTPTNKHYFGQYVIVLCATSDFGFCFFLDNGSISFNRKKTSTKKINPKISSLSASSTIHRF